MEGKFDNRIEMLNLIQPNTTIAELGVFRGEFSKQILDILSPKKLILIDSWSGVIGSGDVNGNNKKTFSGEVLYEEVVNLFINNNNVEVLLAKTNIITGYDDNTFDMIYVDADHEYKGCLRDLENSYKKLKNGGYLMGHDYDQNMAKTSNKIKTEGVKRAVDTFCEIYNQKIEYLAMDGCVSYAIKIKK